MHDQTIKILIVEDSPTTARALRRLLSDFNVVGVARDGAEAERLERRLQPDVVTMDIHLPDTDGLELTFATHVVGPHLLTRLLRGRLEQSPDARVVWVSSGGMYTRRLNLRDPNWTARREYDGVLAYAETKRAQVVLSELWAEQLRGTSVKVNAMHPGWADTPAVQSSIPGFYQLTRRILRTPAEGADTIIWLAASDAAREHTGEFFFDREFVEWSLTRSFEAERIEDRVEREVPRIVRRLRIEQASEESPGQERVAQALTTVSHRSVT